MQPIPIPIKNVSLYPYLATGPVGPVVEPVITDARGTYAVGTLATWIYYNLDLEGGERLGPINKGDAYIARAEAADGQIFETHWVRCMTTGAKPTFGLSVNMLSGNSMLGSPAPRTADESPYIVLGELTDLSGVIAFPPPAIGMISVIENGTGELIATRFGTPHLMGVRVKSGIISPMRQGEVLTMVAGKDRKTGAEVQYRNLRVVALGDEPVLLQSFP